MYVVGMYVMYPLKKPLLTIYLQIRSRETFLNFVSLYNLFRNCIPVFLNCYNLRTHIFFTTGGGGDSFS